MSDIFRSQLGNRELKWETSAMADATMVVLTETLEHVTVISETMLIALF